MPLKISIITVCFNSSKTIADTINSVNKQDYSYLEHIFVDGKSSDSSIEIIEMESTVSKKIVSEKDAGIYDAMNKGIELASGDIIGTLNADDLYENPSVLSEIAKIFEDPTIDACYGDLLYVKEGNTSQTVRYWKSSEYKIGAFKFGWVPGHPTFFVRRGVYERFGEFNLDYKIASDFEIMFRLIEIHKIKVKYLPKVLVKMRLGGTTNKNISNIIKQNKEIFRVLKNYYSDFSLTHFLIKKLLNRISQFLNRPPTEV